MGNKLRNWYDYNSYHWIRVKTIFVSKYFQILFSASHVNLKGCFQKRKWKIKIIWKKRLLLLFSNHIVAGRLFKLPGAFEIAKYDFKKGYLSHALSCIPKHVE